MGACMAMACTAACTVVMVACMAAACTAGCMVASMAAVFMAQAASQAVVPLLAASIMVEAASGWAAWVVCMVATVACMEAACTVDCMAVCMAQVCMVVHMAACMAAYGGLYGHGGLSSSRYGLSAEQAGTWEGLWYSPVASGPITLNLIQDPVVVSNYSGYVQLIGNATLPLLLNVTGSALNSQLSLTGTYLGTGGTITLDIAATLISSTSMQGSYTLGKLGTATGTTVVEIGTFTATLTTPII